jgi:Nuclease-related domain
MTVTATVPIGVGAWLAPTDFLRGIVVGGGIVAVTALLMTLVVQATGTATLSAGAEAEQLTAIELRPLLKHGGRLINHLSLTRGDIDHLLMGPAGIVAVETQVVG